MSAIRDLPTDELVIKGKQATHMLKHARFAEVAAVVEELTKRVGQSCSHRIAELEAEVESWRKNYA